MASEPVCPPTPCKQTSRVRTKQPVRDEYKCDYVSKINPEDSYRIIFGEKHQNPDLAGKVIQIENTDITIHISDVREGVFNLFSYAAEIRQKREVLLAQSRLETSNINPFYRGEDLLACFKSFKIRDSSGNYVDFTALVANNKEDKSTTKRVKIQNDENQEANSADLQWRDRPIPRSLMFVESPAENARQDDKKFKLPQAPVKRSFQKPT